jgi:hypothetical protein
MLTCRPDTSNPEPAAARLTRDDATLRSFLQKIEAQYGNLSGRDPVELWQFYILLVEVEAAFKNLKDDLKLRPILQSAIKGLGRQLARYSYPAAKSTR